MKPTKNRFFCQACGRTKMLFDNEKSALNFIKFNGEALSEESGKAPVRAYYCNLCGGWHVTSNPYVQFFEHYKSRAERQVERALAQKEEMRINKNLSFRNRGQEHICNHKFLKAVDVFLCGYHYLKTSDTEEAAFLVRESFRALSMGLSELMDKETIEEREKKLYKSMRKRLGKVVASFPEYKESFDIIEKACQKLAIELDVIETPEPVLTKKELKAINKAQNALKLKKIDKCISDLDMYLSLGQYQESYLIIRNDNLSVLFEASKCKALHSTLLPKVKTILGQFEQIKAEYSSDTVADTDTKLSAIYKVVSGEASLKLLEDILASDNKELQEKKKEEKLAEKLSNLNIYVSQLEFYTETQQQKPAERNLRAAKKLINDLSSDSSLKEELVPIIDRLIAAIEKFNETFQDSDEVCA